MKLFSLCSRPHVSMSDLTNEMKIVWNHEATREKIMNEKLPSVWSRLGALPAHIEMKFIWFRLARGFRQRWKVKFLWASKFTDGRCLGIPRNCATERKMFLIAKVDENHNELSVQTFFRFHHRLALTRPKLMTFHDDFKCKFANTRSRSFVRTWFFTFGWHLFNSSLTTRAQLRNYI